MNGWRYGAIALAFAMTVSAANAQSSVASSNLARGGLDSPGERESARPDFGGLPAVPVRGNGRDPATPGTELGSTGMGADGRMVGPRAAITHPEDLRLRPDPTAPRGASYGPVVADKSRQSHASEFDR